MEFPIDHASNLDTSMSMQFLTTLYFFPLLFFLCELPSLPLASPDLNTCLCLMYIVTTFCTLSTLR